MTQKFVQTPAIALYVGMSAVATSCRITPYPVDLDGNKLTFADFGDTPTFTVDPKISQYEEICSFTGITDNGDDTATLTGLVRNLTGKSPYTTPGTGKQHGSSAVVVFSDNPQMYARLASKDNDNTFTGLNVFNGYAPQTDTDPISANDMVRLSYLQALVLGTLTTIDVIVPGTAGGTITAGNLIYLDTSVGKWKRCDADTATTVENVLLGIAQSSAATNAAIASGVLLQGVDAHQSGLTIGSIYYASNTAGGISITVGTTEVTVGIAKSATELYFDPRFNQQITEDQQDALAGTSGTAPSVTNKFVDNADTTGTGLIARASTLAALASAKQTFTAGAAITAGNALHLSPYVQSDGGILLDTQASAAFSNATNQSQSVTVGSNSNRALLVGVIATSAPSSVAYNSVSMTLVDSQVLDSGYTLYAYKLAAPSTGANNILVTGTGIYAISWGSYYNVSQGTLVEASAKSQTGVVGGTSTSITTLSGGAFVHMFAAEHHTIGSASAVSATYGSKYSSAASATSSRAAPSGLSIAAVSVSKFNEVVTTSVSASVSGVSNTGSSANIVMSLAPATAFSAGVVPANSSVAGANEPLVDFIGFADSSVALGASVSVTTQSVVSGLSGLTPGARYYLQDVDGTIGTTSGTYTKFIGTALTATTLLLQKEKMTSAQISKSANYTYTAETDGFVLANAPASTTVTISGSASSTATSPGSTSTNMSVPVRRGTTYIVSSAGTFINFVPMT